jgi:hypothetical protein
MSTLTYASQDRAAAVPADVKPGRKPFWSRLFDAIVESQQRRADREVARWLASHGDILTDEREREIMRRLMGNGGRLR